MVLKLPIRRKLIPHQQLHIQPVVMFLLFTIYSTQGTKHFLYNSKLYGAFKVATQLKAKIIFIFKEM